MYVNKYNMNITLGQLRKIISEELRKNVDEDLYSQLPGYNKNEYDSNGINLEDLKDLEDSEVDLPSDNINFGRNKFTKESSNKWKV